MVTHIIDVLPVGVLVRDKTCVFYQSEAAAARQTAAPVIGPTDRHRRVFDDKTFEIRFDDERYDVVVSTDVSEHQRRESETTI